MTSHTTCIQLFVHQLSFNIISVVEVLKQPAVLAFLDIGMSLGLKIVAFNYLISIFFVDYLRNVNQG